MHEHITYYTNRLPDLEIRLAGLQRSLTRISTGRLITFSAIFAAIFLFNQLGSIVAITIMILMTILFGFLIKKHIRVSDQKSYVQQMIIIHRREIEILSYRFDQQDPGKEFMDIHHRFSYDLDLFGEGSLFQFINRTIMKKGRALLASWFTHPCSDIHVLQARQGALKELAGKNDFCLDFRTTGELTIDSTDDLHQIKTWFNETPSFHGSIFYRISRLLFPALSIASIILTLINGEFYRLIILLFLVQLAIIGIKIRTTNRIHNVLTQYVQTFIKIGRLLNLVEKEEFSSTAMTSLKAKLHASGYPAYEAINQLSKLLSAFDTRLNVLAGIILNGFLLWDVQCIWRLEEWKIRYRDHFELWVDGLAEIDALISQATFHFNFPAYTCPEFTDKEMIRAADLGHPLIPDEQRVCNDFVIPSAGTIVVITGANMAGKSTFLRSVGINLVLAMAGAPVCAGKFSFNPARLFTSMRTSDSLLHHESYFYAELKRIKTIVDELAEDRKMLIILDEILKGTNSDDKHKGSLAVLERIFALGGTAIIATHDLELAKTESHDKKCLINKCFEIEINGTEVMFDYILRDGITQKMNASLLMKQMGIIE
ncbi:MAG: hypothetical protein JXK95_15505 [Bacteroidales bacterium]|nr:hypothetical protein [Bacteroidales bacterium]